MDCTLLVRYFQTLLLSLLELRLEQTLMHGKLTFKVEMYVS